ncbi:unnamed protein product [Rotaria sordida]|uniref:Uncharacterized protein n=1 Tax=Rotaria sordida TaxID=392033 RepID=A0A815LIB8_9BILA|nr:unnamed protein product [Rotaria sordida]CAF1409752.1 unnamed protein product [Rotaria sordida]
MLLLFFLVFVLFSQINVIFTHCEQNPLCRLSNDSTIMICDSIFGSQNESSLSPIISCLPTAKIYLFRNFEQIPSHTFQNVTFPENQSFIIKLINISIIDTEAFSNSLIIPRSSKLSIEIGELDSLTSIRLKSNAFNNIKIDHLHFFNFNDFNGHSIFDTDCFGNNLEINKLTFEQCNIIGFSNIISKTVNVYHLSIKSSSNLIQLTDKNLPLFLSTSKSFEISNTSLEIINPHTFQAWSLVLEELIISNNLNFEIFPLMIIDGVLMKLHKLDLSYNSIKILDGNYDWFAYSYTKYLLLRKQQLDLFLKTNILKTLTFLEKIDFSEGFISDDNNNDDLIKNYFPNMSHLNSIDISYTNLSENMIIDLLTSISKIANHFITIGLYGHTLSNKNFCSYYKIFKNAPNLLQLELDKTHECNCVIDLFYSNQLREEITNYSLLQPTCLFNSTRMPCNIEKQLSLSNCTIGGQHVDESNTDSKVGNYAFGAVVAVLTIVLLILLSLGFGVVYQIRRRRLTDLDMEQPVENPLNAIIEERLQNK